MLNMGLKAIFTAVALASATSAPAQQREVEYPRGSLAYEALMSNDLSRAERELRADDRVMHDDPARLLNFGFIYQKTGRDDLARKMFEKVLSKDDVELVLSDGRTMSSRSAARVALNGLAR